MTLFQSEQRKEQFRQRKEKLKNLFRDIEVKRQADTKKYLVGLSIVK